MKKIILLSIGIAFALFSINSCKKSDISGDAKQLVEGSYIVLDSSINVNLDISNAASTVSIKVSQYGSPVASINVFAATGSNALDTTGWVLIKNVPYSDGVVLSVSTAELNTALAPAVASPGNSYVFQNEVVTKDGRKFSVNNTPSNFVSLPGYNMALTWQGIAVCAFTGNMAGKYKVIQDDWQDWVPGDQVQVTDGPGANQVNLSAVWPNPAYGSVVNPLVVNVDPANGSATVPNVDFGDYGYLASTLSGSGYIFSCTGFISLTIDIFAKGYGDQGAKKLILQKQ